MTLAELNHMRKNTFTLHGVLALFALRRLVDDYEPHDANVSLFTAQLRCARIHFLTFLLTLKLLFFKLNSVRACKMELTQFLMRLSMFCC